MMAAAVVGGQAIASVAPEKCNLVIMTNCISEIFLKNLCNDEPIKSPFESRRVSKIQRALGNIFM